MHRAYSLRALVLAPMGLARMGLAPVGLAIILLACGTSKQEKVQGEQTAKEKLVINPPPPGPAPGTCKIVATVETIDKTLKGTSEKDPCGKAPCMATIKIDSVLGYGSAFPTVLGLGKRLTVRFAHSLNPTKDVWPEIQPPLPGLRVGAKFEALINGASLMGKTEPEFTIYSYVTK